MKNFIIGFFTTIVSVTTLAETTGPISLVQPYCTRLKDSGFSEKISCLKSKLETKIASCTNEEKVKRLKYNIVNCTDSSNGGYAPIGGNTFNLCENGLRKARNEFVRIYSNSPNKDTIAEFLFESVVFYTMIHESFHLVGLDHSSSMDSIVSNVLTCAGIKPAFNGYGVVADWVTNLDQAQDPETIPTTVERIINKGPLGNELDQALSQGMSPFGYLLLLNSKLKSEDISNLADKALPGRCFDGGNIYYAPSMLVVKKISKNDLQYTSVTTQKYQTVSDYFDKITIKEFMQPAFWEDFLDAQGVSNELIQSTFDSIFRTGSSYTNSKGNLTLKRTGNIIIQEVTDSAEGESGILRQPILECYYFNK